VKAQFAELTYESNLYDCRHPQGANKKSILRIAVAEESDEVYVSIADFLEFIKVHNRLNAQSMTSNLMGDLSSRAQYKLMYGSVDGSKRRTPMISLDTQFPKYVRSLGDLRALKGNDLLPDRNGGTLWEEYLASDQPKWLEDTLKTLRGATNGTVSGVICTEWTDDQWARRLALSGASGGGGAKVGSSRRKPAKKPKLLAHESRFGAETSSFHTEVASQPARQRSARLATSPSLPKTKWVFRSLKTVLVTLPSNMNAGASFGLRIPGCEMVVAVEFPESGVPGKQIKFPLDPPLRQKVLRAELLPGEKSEPCYVEGDDNDLLQDETSGAGGPQTQERRIVRPTSRVPLPDELVAMRAEMQRQPGLQCADVSGGKEKRPIPVVNTVDEAQLDLNTFRYVSTPEITPKIQTLIDQAPAVPCNCTGTCGGVGNAVCGCVERFGEVYDLVVKVTLKTLPPNQPPLVPQVSTPHLILIVLT